MPIFNPSEINNLMPMPISSVRLAEMVSDPDSTVKGFARVIELDQALTLDVLRWANSSFGAPDSPIETVRDAVVRLGTANVLKLAVGQHLLAAFSSTLAKTELGENELWRHSVAAALASENIGRHTKKRIPGVAFTAALVHDVGKLILCRRVGYDAFHEIIRGVVEEKKVTPLEAERIFFNTDHAEVGGAVARHWKFSEDIISAIEKHHTANVGQGILLDVVILANISAHAVDRNVTSEMATAQICLEHLRMTNEIFETMVDQIRVELNTSTLLWQ